MKQWCKNIQGGRLGSLLCSGLMFVMCLSGSATHAQINRFLQQGNKLYEQGKFKEATEDYTKALQKDPNNVPGMFNLGNSLYQQKQYDASRKVMANTAKLSKDKNGKAAANYNIGNTYMSQQKWEDAINAYKQTLKNNPQDADAKYNLSYARQMMKKEQEQNKENKDNKDNKDQQDKKDKQDQQDKKDKQNKDKQDQQKQDQQDKKDEQQKEQQQPQSQPSKLSEQQAEQLLNALQQQEKKLQDKMKKEKGVPVKMERDW